jgi:hypothetical protein
MLVWLAAQIDNDEAQARRAKGCGDRWTAVTNGDFGPGVRTEVGSDVQWRREIEPAVWRCADEADGCPEDARGCIAEAEHIARNDPASVLRRVAAHRAILDVHTGGRSYVYTDDGSPACDACGDGTVRWPCPTVQHLAMAYASRDGYQEKWGSQ